MSMDQQETFNWLVNEKARLETERDQWRDRCFELALQSAKNNPAIRAEIERCRKAETIDASIFNLVLTAPSPVSDASPSEAETGREDAAIIIERGWQLREAITEYARDLRRNSSGGDNYPWETMRGVANYLDTLVQRYSACPSETREASVKCSWCGLWCHK